MYGFAKLGFRVFGPPFPETIFVRRSRTRLLAPSAIPLVRLTIARAANPSCGGLDDFVEGEFDDADGARLNQLGKKLAHSVLADDGFDCQPFFALQIGALVEACETVGAVIEGSRATTASRCSAAQFILTPTRLSASSAPIIKNTDLTDFGLLPGVKPGVGVGYQHRRRSE